MQYYGRKPREGQAVRPAMPEKPFPSDLPVKQEGIINNSVDGIIFDIEKNPPIKEGKRLHQSPDYGGSLIPGDLPVKPANSFTTTPVDLEKGELNIIF